jgi:hypothetical protein
MFDQTTATTVKVAPWQFQTQRFSKIATMHAMLAFFKTTVLNASSAAPFNVHMDNMLAIAQEGRTRNVSHAVTVKSAPIKFPHAPHFKTLCAHPAPMSYLPIANMWTTAPQRVSPITYPQTLDAQNAPCQTMTA